MSLSGYHIIELAGIGPVPYAGQIFAQMGAKVTVIKRPNATEPLISHHGKSFLEADLRTPEGVDVALALIKNADGLIEGMRPGAAERLGLGPKDCHSINPKLVYGRMTGWGQNGPWARMAGHDINYIGLTGALHAMGEAGRPPPPPLNLIGDYGGGSLFLVNKMLAAFLSRAQIDPDKRSDAKHGVVIDAAIIDGVTSMMGIVHDLDAIGLWQPERGANILDGAMPYYRCYATADNRFIAVGCIEPKFFAIMLEKLGIDPSAFGGQNDPACRLSQRAQLETIFASQTRNHWAAHFDGTDACVTPVLNYSEAACHKQNSARPDRQ
ncbi:MAG: CaiB/BaiF CoA-transferase family protein [Robiginitomaculum sp.]